jgi:predicted dehydrogenase
MPHRPSRRRFLGEAATLSAAVTFAGTLPADNPKKTPPSERLNLGIIGLGGQGNYNRRHVQHENIVALCDVDRDGKHVAEAREANPKADFYQDFRKLLDRKDMDAVVIATPDHWHAIPTVMALRAGKHVYCEKPLTHSVHEVRTVMETAAKTGAVTQMGTQIHAENNYRRAVEIVQSGALGTVSRVHVWCLKRPDTRKLSAKPMPVPAGFDYDLWLGPAAQQPYDSAFIPFHWRWWWNFGGGILADMACHYVDLAHWALDLRTPTTIAATGKKLGEGDHDVPDILQADYQYPARGDKPAVHLTWYSGVKGPSLDAKEAFHGFDNGVYFIGDKGQLLADYTKVKLLPEDQFKDFKPPKQTIPASIGHHKEWLEAIKTKGPTTCNFAYSGALAEAVLLGNVAFRCGQKITWDGAAGKADVAEAAKYLRREYRNGWKL